MNIEGFRLVGILTTPSQIDVSDTGKPMAISTHTSFDDLAARVGCEVVEMRGKKTTAAYLQHLERWRPHLLLVLGWYYIVPRRVRQSATISCLGIHASLLPKYRGWAPITWAIINGETETGVTLFHLEDDVDSGDVVAQISLPIEERDTCATMYEKASHASIELLREYLPRLAQGTAPRASQDEGLAAYFPQRKPDDGLIDWTKSPEEVRNFIRAQTKPYPGAFTYIGGKKVTVWDADISPQEHS